MYTYKPHGVCSRQINFDIDGDIVRNIEIIGGCRGNTEGVARLASGRPIDEVIDMLLGIPCRGGTSCPDQLAKALIEYKNSIK